MSYAAYMETDIEPWPILWRRPGVLTASLAAGAATLCLSGAAVVYALTHIPEVDPDAAPPPVAALAAAAPITPTKLDVLPPPVYGPGIVNLAPAVPFTLASATGSGAVPVNARTTMDSVDMAKLAEADGVAAPCDDPCVAEAGYAVPDTPDEREAPQDAVVVRDADDDDGGNAPPPPDMAVNESAIR